MLNRIYKVAVYLRLSKEDGDNLESESITNQRKIIKDYINKQENMKIYAEYVDDGYSGANFNRPDFKKMINDIKNKFIDIVITKDLSRFGRDYVECGEYIEKVFPDNGVRYIAVLDKIDSFKETVINDFLPLKSLFNEKHCKNTSVSVKKSKRARMKEGIYACSVPPFGYKKDMTQDGKLIIDEEASKTVKKIFELKLEGYTAIKIAEYLQKNNYLTPGQYLKNVYNPDYKNTNVWKRDGVNRILCNQVYLGHCIRGKTQNLSYKNRKRLYVRREDCIVNYNTHEAIVSEDDFYKIHNSNKYGCRKTEYSNQYLLRNLLFCRICGKQMYFRNERKKVKITCGNNRNSSYLCDNTRKIDYLWLEEYIRKQIQTMHEKYLKNSRYMDKLYIEYQKIEVNTLKKEIDRYNKKITKVNSQISLVYSKRLSGDTKENYEEKYKNLVAERKNIENILNEVTRQLNERQKLIYKAENKEKIFKEFDDAVKKELTNKDMKKLIDRIEIDNEEIIVRYNFDIM